MGRLIAAKLFGLRLLPLGHSSTENSCQGSVGEKSRHEFECPRSVGLISKFSAFVLLRACVDASGDGGKPQGLSPQAMARPDDRRIFTMGQDE